MKRKQLFQLKTTSLFNPKQYLNIPARRNHATVTKQQAATWTEWYNSSVNYMYPYFTSEYYYIGQVVVVAGVAVTCYYVVPYVAKKFYDSNAAEAAASSTLPTQNQPTTAAESAASSILSTQTPSEPTIVKQAAEIVTSLSSKQEEEIRSKAFSYMKSAYENISFSSANNITVKQQKCGAMIKDLTELTKLITEHGEILKKYPVTARSLKNVYKLAHDELSKLGDKLNIENMDTLLESLLTMSTYFN